MELIKGSIINPAPTPVQTVTPVQIAEREAALRLYVIKLVKEIRLKKRLNINAFCVKYGVARSQLYRIENGVTVFPSDKFLTILITEGYTLNLETINKEILGATNV